jgi:hypothetical protein
MTNFWLLICDLSDKSKSYGSALEYSDSHVFLFEKFKGVHRNIGVQKDSETLI